MNKYKKLMKMIEDEDSTEDLYNELVKKEQKTLNLLNRISAKKIEEAKNKSFLHMSLTELIYLMIHEWKMIFHEVMLFGVNTPTTKDILLLFHGDKRMFTIGMSSIIIALILFFIESSK